MPVTRRQGETRIEISHWTVGLRQRRPGREPSSRFRAEFSIPSGAFCIRERPLFRNLQALVRPQASRSEHEHIGRKGRGRHPLDEHGLVWVDGHQGAARDVRYRQAAVGESATGEVNEIMVEPRRGEIGDGVGPTVGRVVVDEAVLPHPAGQDIVAVLPPEPVPALVAEQAVLSRRPAQEVIATAAAQGVVIAVPDQLI